MIWVLGSSGYIGQAFVRELKARGLDFCGLSRATFDYMDRFFWRLVYQGENGPFPQG